VPQDVKPVQRLGLSAIPVAREQQLAPAPLAQRVAGRRDLQLPDHVVMAAQGQLGSTRSSRADSRSSSEGTASTLANG
jgi:hypothetical protein